MLTRFRLLPIVIVSASLLLGLKIGDIWVGLDQLSPLAARSAIAASGEKEGSTGESDNADGVVTTSAPALDTSNNVEDDVIDPTQFSKSEIDVLQRLGERREELEKRNRELDMRENLLSATEARIDDKINELKKIEAAVSALLKQHDEQEDKQLASLVKIYEKMKPKDAARILEKLDMGVLLTVAERMREAKMANVMAHMDDTKAKALTMELATRRRLPEVNGGSDEDG
jgi:flagellar motility protein MotE (MotC chaperone)